MTAPPATHQPAPTVRRHRQPAARRLVLLAGYTLLAAAFAGPGLWLLHQHYLAIEVAAIAVVLAALLAALACAVAARRLTFNPWPFAAIMTVVAAAAAWVVLPLAGLARLRLVTVVLAGWLAVAGLMRWRTHHLRERAHHRWAQALEPEVSAGTGKSHAEQIAAGLTGVARADRITAPHLGVAPHAAWELRVTRWDRVSIRVAVLRLPWVSDLGNPDLMVRIRRALTTRAGVEHLTLSSRPLQDEIIITVLDGPETQESAATLVELAVERARVAAEMVPLKGAKVTGEEVDDKAAALPAGAAAGIAGTGHLLVAFTVQYEPTKIVTKPENRALITAHMSTQLYGAPDQLRARWSVDQDQVLFRRRRQFPDLIPHRVLDLTSIYGDQLVLAFAEDEDGQIVVYPLSKTPLPHGLVIGKTGGGKTVLLVTLAIEAARLGVEVWGCDPKRIELMGLRGWPNVTKIATRVADMIRLVDEFFEEMNRRYELIETGQARARDFHRILLILDEYFVFVMFVAEWWAAKRDPSDPKVHPVLAKIAQIAAMSRSAGMHIVIGVQRPDAAFFTDGARDNFGFRVSLGPLSQQAALMLWGDAHTGTDVPAIQGLCTATSPAGPVRAKVHATPNPADALTGDLSDEDWAHLRSLLPSGATWDGPLRAEAPDPGFEDTAAAYDAVEADAATALLTLVRAALRSGTAHLTDGTTGGPPNAENRSLCGWWLSGGGSPEPSGTWIGCATSTRAGRRVYLYPQRAFEVATAFAQELGVPFRWNRDQLDKALRASGLLRVEKASDGKRNTVRVPLPGNDLPEVDRPRAWDLPEDAVLGDLPPSTQPAAAPAPAGPDAPPSWPDPDGLAAGPFDAAEDTPVPGSGMVFSAVPVPEHDAVLNGGQESWWAWGRDLHNYEGQAIILPSWAEPDLGSEVVAILVAAGTDPQHPGKVVVDYLVDSTPGGIVIDPDDQIRFAQ